MGVNRDMWLTLSDGKGFMPGIAIDGKLMLDAYAIVQHL